MAMHSWQKRADELLSILQRSSTIAIYGAGLFGRKSYHSLNEMFDLNVSCFLDKDPQKIGTTFEGIEIRDPEDYQVTDGPILIASIFTHEICPWLEEKGFNNTYIYLAAYLAQPNYRSAVHQIEEQLKDQYSQQTLTDLLDHYFGLRTCPPRSDFPQYIHPKISYDPETHILDGGAYDGDTVRLFKSHYGLDCQVHAFEPNDEIFALLTEYAAENRCVNPIHSGLWHETGELYFHKKGAYAGQILHAHDGSLNENIEIVKVTAIDDMLADGKIGLIKMDIEGAELSALKGGVTKIKEDRPNLAICIYHKPEDWITIPKFIMENSKEHDFYLGHHSHNLFETVFYAVRKNA